MDTPAVVRNNRKSSSVHFAQFPPMVNSHTAGILLSHPLTSFLVVVSVSPSDGFSPPPTTNLGLQLIVDWKWEKQGGHGHGCI